MNIPELIKEAHGDSIKKGFYDCPICYGSKKICIGASQCDHDGSECTYEDNCGEYELGKCRTCKGTGINPNRNIGELLMLIVSELGEALEAHRKKRFASEMYKPDLDDWLSTDYEWSTVTNKAFESTIKDTFEDEIADVFIRLFDLCGYLKEDLNYNGVKINNTNVGQLFFKIIKLLPHDDSNDAQPFNAFYSAMMNMCEKNNIDIEKHIKAKMAYNKTRPHKHGKEY